MTDTVTHERAVPPEPRNTGTGFDQGWVAALRVDPAGIETAAARLPDRRPADRDTCIARLLRVVSCTDLTTLAGDDTPARVQGLCATARQPLSPGLLRRLGRPGPTVAAVCVHHAMIATARAALAGSEISVATVSGGFPAGLSPLRARLIEIEESVAAGATEIDIVIPRYLALAEDWQSLYDEISAMRAACGPAHLKTILSTGELGSLDTVARTALVAMMAGSDFVKTSTGKEAVNATLPASLAMARAIRDYAARTGLRVGFKAAGGISTADAAWDFQQAVEDELGCAWQAPALFRFGASSLLADIERRLTALAA